MKGLRDYISGLKLLSRNLWLFLCSVLVMGIGRQIFMVLRNQYLVDLGLPDPQVTSVQAFNSLGGLLIVVPALVIIGRFRAKSLLVCIVAVNACGFALQGVFGTLEVFRGAALAAGVSMSLNMALAAPFLMRQSTPGARVFAFSLNSAVGWPLSGFIGSFLSGELQLRFARLAGDSITFFGDDITGRMFGYRATLLVASALVLLAIVPISLIREEPAEGKGKSIRELFRVSEKKRLLLLGLPEMIIGIGAGLTIPFFNVYFKNEWGLNPQQIAPIFMAMFGLLVVSYLLQPVLVKRFGPVKVMIASQILSLPFFIELALGNHLWLAIAAFIARQCLMNASDPIYKQFAQEVMPDQDRNAVALFVHSSRHAFFTVANFASGYLIALDGGHFRIVIVTTIVCYVVAIGVELAILPGLNRARRYRLAVSERATRRFPALAPSLPV